MATSVASEERERERDKREECVRLQESLLIAEEECRVLRNREKSLLEEMTKKEEDYIEKLITIQEEKIKLKCENWSLKEQLSRWKNKYVQEKVLAADSCNGFVSTTPDNQPCKKRNYTQQKTPKFSGNSKEVVDVGLQSCHHSRAYAGRIPSTEEMECALKRAEKLKRKLSCYPSFIKKAVLSNVSSCFWLGIPLDFSKKYLPLDKMKMVLEDEKGVNYDATFIGRKSALSGGWRCFALDHNLEYGDVIVFELTEPARFKIYITRAKAESSEDAD